MSTRIMSVMAVVAVVAGLGRHAPGAGWDDFGDAVDLAAFHEIDPALAEPLPVDPVTAPVQRSISAPARPARTFYISGLIGTSFATLEDEAHNGIVGGALTGEIFTGGIAAGMGFARDNGQWRIEVEGRGRDRLTESFVQSPSPGFYEFGTFAASDGWSALVNMWRDYTLGERLGAYLGGGLGAGGYTYGLASGVNIDGDPFVRFDSQSAETTFAWQAGCGVLWKLSPRVTFDVGYRFFALEPVNTLVSVSGFEGEGLVPTRNRFTASELLFTLRIEEPFRRWTR